MVFLLWPGQSLGGSDFVPSPRFFPENRVFKGHFRPVQWRPVLFGGTCFAGCVPRRPPPSPPYPPPVGRVRLPEGTVNCSWTV